MWPLIDPRKGDFESDASSSQSRSLWSIAGGMLAEISLPKLIVAWFVLLGLPALLLGAMPIVASIWINATTLTLVEFSYGLVPLLLLIALAATALLGARRAVPAGRAQLLVAERPCRAAGLCPVSRGPEPDRGAGASTGCDDGKAGEVARHHRHRVRLNHLSSVDRHPSAGLAARPFCGGVLRAPRSPSRSPTAALANSVAIVAAYVAAAVLVWSVADATMPMACDLERFAEPASGEQTSDGTIWRIAHLSDIHVVGETYGFRIESGRSGPRGNDRLIRVLRAPG